MAKTNYQDIDAYHMDFSGETLSRMKTIRQIIHDVVPDVEECISYQIPCFKYNGYLIYYAAFPKHISLSHPFSAGFLEHFKTALEGYKVSKAVIQFPTDKPLPTAFISKIISYRKRENEASAKAKNATAGKAGK
ncbi:iron chaperone [Flavobacterium sp.]